MDTGKESSIRRIAEDPASGLQSDSKMRGRQPRGDTLFNCWHLSFYRSLSGVARISYYGAVMSHLAAVYCQGTDCIGRGSCCMQVNMSGTMFL